MFCVSYFSYIIKNIQGRLLFANLKKFIGMLEGIFQPLEIGLHLGSKLGSLGVNELPSGQNLGRRWMGA